MIENETITSMLKPIEVLVETGDIKVTPASCRKDDEIRPA